MQNFTVLANDESDSVRESTCIQDTVGFGHLGVGVTQDRIVELQRFGECCVLLDRIAACCEVSDVVLTQGLTARTERFAFGRSATGEGFRVPRDHNGLFAFEL